LTCAIRRTRSLRHPAALRFIHRREEIMTAQPPIAPGPFRMWMFGTKLRWKHVAGVDRVGILVAGVEQPPPATSKWLPLAQALQR